MKSGNLNFLEPSGPIQACNRTALPISDMKLNVASLHVLCETVCELGQLQSETNMTTVVLPYCVITDMP